MALLAVAGVAACAGPGTSAGSAPVAVVQRATFFHAGYSAGPALFTDSAGQLLEERRFEPFGAPIGTPDLVARDLNALNQRSDAATGWSDHGARWLATATGRWQSTDPPVSVPNAQFMAAPWGLHPYQYVGQNPVAFWDPDGREPARLQQIDEQKRERDQRLLDQANALVGRLRWVPTRIDVMGRPAWKTPSMPYSDHPARIMNEFAMAARGETDFPLSISARMDSFEFILYAGYRAGVVRSDSIRAAYATPSQDWVQQQMKEATLGAGRATPWTGGAIPAGSLVFIQVRTELLEGGPVFLSTGNVVHGSPELIGLWGETRGGSVSLTTVGDATRTMQSQLGVRDSAIAVTHAPSPW